MPIIPALGNRGGGRHHKLEASMAYMVISQPARNIEPNFSSKRKDEVVHTFGAFNPITQATEAGGSLGVPGQPTVWSKVCKNYSGA